MPKPAISTRNTLGKNERLKSRKLIGHLFKEGNSFSIAPLRVLYSLAGETTSPLQAGFSVSSKKFKKAVDRNRIKRLLREAYRQQKHPLKIQLEENNKQLAVFFIYTGREIPEHAFIYEKMGIAIQMIVRKTE